MKTLPLPVLPPLASRARVRVALSGGLDSTVLLHALVQRGVPGLQAVHVHHGLQPAADGWVHEVRASCCSLGVPLLLRRVRVAPGGEGPEAAARAARHAVFAQLLRPGDLLVTAHHLDDQAETVLLRALRGTGVDGLAAMQTLADYGRGRVWRPLLALPRARLEAYAHEHRLQWVEDPHNADPRYARSYLRHEIWPRLHAHWPQASGSLARLAQHAQETAGLMAELAQADATALGIGVGIGVGIAVPAPAGAARAGSSGRAGPGRASRSGPSKGAPSRSQTNPSAVWPPLPVAALGALSAARRHNLLRWIWARQGELAPSADWLVRFDRELLGARADREPCLAFSGFELRRYRDRIHVLPPLPPVPPPGLELEWPARARICRLPPGCGELRAARAPGHALRVRFAHGGERLRPLGSAHRRTLKQLCQEAGVPVWLRPRLPLLFDGATLLSVAGRWNAAELAQFDGFAPRWHCELPGWPAA